MIHYWDAKRGMVADTATRKSWSVHGQVQAILLAPCRKRGDGLRCGSR